MDLEPELPICTAVDLRFFLSIFNGSLFDGYQLLQGRSAIIGLNSYLCSRARNRGLRTITADMAVSEPASGDFDLDLTK